MRRKCYLPKSFDELKNLSDKKLQFYWDTFYTYPMIGHKAKLRPLWYAIQCELGRCKLPEKYITRLERYANNPDKYIERAHKNRYSLSVGTLLTKKYKGQIYQVTVKGEQEYEWEGKTYPNLTVIASAISNCHVSGPAFFGLMERKMAKVNCAVYTRKSNERGLDSEFSSLQNQEDACKAYILSQAFNGWEYSKTFEDGGISGGTMERPGLQALLEEIRAHRIQVVVVYKVDRLSRSIFDFHKMMQEFAKYECNFVSITQSFDTSNSMGKLTLNMLLFFAQFEREVSAERVRDKLAATKAKGMWVGGVPSIGYDLKDKQLVPNEQESEEVRLIFQKYLELGNIMAVAEWMNAQGYRSKRWKTKKGEERGGKPFSHSSILKILSNPLYVGKMPHFTAKKVYPGKQPALISQEMFEAVQAKVGNYKNGLREYRAYIRKQTLMADKLFDDRGNPYKLTSTTKNGQKFQYYFIRKGVHIPVIQLDGFVLDTIRRADLSSVDLQADSSQISSDEAKKCLKQVICVKKGTNCSLQIALDKRVFLDICHNRQKKTEKPSNPVLPEVGAETITLRDAFYIDNVTSTRLQHGTSQNILTVRQLNESLVRGLARAWKLKKLLEKGLKTREWEKAGGMNKRTFARYVNLCYLSPRIVGDILEYKNPCNLTLRELMNIAEGNVDFGIQEQYWQSN